MEMVTDNEVAILILLYFLAPEGLTQAQSLVSPTATSGPKPFSSEQQTDAQTATVSSSPIF
jgi:hypothetical protein